MSAAGKPRLSMAGSGWLAGRRAWPSSGSERSRRPCWLPISDLGSCQSSAERHVRCIFSDATSSEPKVCVRLEVASPIKVGSGIGDATVPHETGWNAWATGKKPN